MSVAGLMIWRMRLRGWTVGAAVLMSMALLGGCGVRGAATDPSGETVPDSGIRGRVVLGPTCPVERPGESCARPYRARIAIRTEPNGKLVVRLRASASGRFRIALAPGTYLLVPRSGRPYPRSSPLTATVNSHSFTNVVIRYDTGIR